MLRLIWSRFFFNTLLQHVLIGIYCFLFLTIIYSETTSVFFAVVYFCVECFGNQSIFGCSLTWDVCDNFCYFIFSCVPFIANILGKIDWSFWLFISWCSACKLSRARFVSVMRPSAVWTSDCTISASDSSSFMMLVHFFFSAHSFHFALPPTRSVPSLRDGACLLSAIKHTLDTLCSNFLLYSPHNSFIPSAMVLWSGSLQPSLFLSLFLPFHILLVMLCLFYSFIYFGGLFLV